MRSDEERLRDILESCEHILELRQDIGSFHNFVRSLRNQNAILYELVKIGEAAAHVSESVRKNNSTIPWQAIKNFRNIIVHHYFGVDWDIIWEVVTSRIPELALEIRAILIRDFPNAV